MAEEERREAETEAYHKFKSNKENSEILYLIDMHWLQKWIAYLRGGRDPEGKPLPSPDYICNERVYRIIF